MNVVTDEKLRVPDAAKRLGITTRDLYEAMHNGQIEFTRDAGEFPLISLAALDTYAATRG